MPEIGAPGRERAGTSSAPLVPAALAHTITGKAMAVRSIFDMLVGIFRDTADRIEASEPIAAKRLRQATPHTLRHTAITWLGNHADIRIQSKFARHADIRTTIKTYDHREEAELAEAIAKLRLPGC